MFIMLVESGAYSIFKPAPLNDTKSERVLTHHNRLRITTLKQIFIKQMYEQLFDVRR